MNIVPQMKLIHPRPALMGLAEVFPPETVLFRLEGRTESDVIAELVRHAVALGRIPRWAEDAVIGLVEERERLGSTALGNGIAFPHCQSAHTEQFIGVAGFASAGIPFRAIDGEPVDTVLLLLAPPDRPGEFFDVLGRMVAIGRDRSLRFLLRGCRTAERVSSFLHELDQVPSEDGKTFRPNRPDVSPYRRIIRPTRR
jgi:PTS system nitrogen regulatory IIA component